MAPVLFSLQQAREDAATHTDGLSGMQLWARPHGLGAAGFHLRHIAGSVDRLTAYLLGRQLTAAQLAAVETEMEPGADREELLSGLDAALARAENIVRGIDPATLLEPRVVGRQRLPTTVIGLLTHLAEHTQRHVGQVISAARLARAAK